MSTPKKSIKQLIKDLEPDELREIITELARVNKKNQNFIRYFIHGINNSGVEELYKDAEQKIFNVFFKRNHIPRSSPAIGTAREVINEFSNYFKDSPEQVISLSLFYSECCLEHLSCGEDYRVLNSMLSVFEGAGVYLCKYPRYIRDFSNRLKLIYLNSDVCGFVPEMLDELYMDLESISGIDLTSGEPDNVKTEVDKPVKETPPEIEIPETETNIYRLF
jgi:hypothetical protein